MSTQQTTTKTTPASPTPPTPPHLYHQPFITINTKPPTTIAPIIVINNIPTSYHQSISLPAKKSRGKLKSKGVNLWGVLIPSLVPSMGVIAIFQKTKAGVGLSVCAHFYLC
jgi:hypothetical protein